MEEGRASLSGRTFRWLNGGKESGACCRFTGQIILLVRITFLLTYSKLEYIITNIEVNKMFINLFKIRVYHPKYSKSWISVGKSFPELHVAQCFQDIQ